jgi:FMNH2-dependent dimethyl sulfone monooxygenase
LTLKFAAADGKLAAALDKCKFWSEILEKQAMPIQFGVWAPVCGGWLRVLNQQVNPSIQQIIELAQLADDLGYSFYYIPEHYLNAVHGPNYDVVDAWISATAASVSTKRISVIVGVQPGFKLPAVVAKMGANLQNQLSRGRFGLSALAGWWKLEAEMYGDVWLSHSERYSRLEEYLDIVQGMWQQDTFEYAGKYYSVPGAILENKPSPLPLVLIAGESDRAIELAARKGDYLFINANELEETAKLVARAKRLAQEKYNRGLKVAMSAFSILCRDDSAEQRLSDLYHRADKTKIDYFQQQMDSNVVAHNKLGTQYTIEANLGLSAHLIGHPESIACRLKEYEAVGVDLVMLKFESMLEDTVQFYQQVISQYFQSSTSRPVLSSV